MHLTRLRIPLFIGHRVLAVAILLASSLSASALQASSVDYILYAGIAVEQAKQAKGKLPHSELERPAWSSRYEDHYAWATRGQGVSLQELRRVILERIQTLRKHDVRVPAGIAPPRIYYRFMDQYSDTDEFDGDEPYLLILSGRIVNGEFENWMTRIVPAGSADTRINDDWQKVDCFFPTSDQTELVYGTKFASNPDDLVVIIALLEDDGAAEGGGVERATMNRVISKLVKITPADRTAELHRMGLDAVAKLWEYDVAAALQLLVEYELTEHMTVDDLIGRVQRLEFSDQDLLPEPLGTSSKRLEFIDEDGEEGHYVVYFEITQKTTPFTSRDYNTL